MKRIINKRGKPAVIFDAKDVIKAKVGRPGFSGKVWFRAPSPGAKPVKKTVFLKLVGNEYFANCEIKIRNRLRQLGLPVPKAGVVKIGGMVYLAVEPYFREGKSKLIPINPFHEGFRDPAPRFLRELELPRDEKLIRNMAEDVATIFSNGISTGNLFDFFGFYRKKDGSYGRAIMDTAYFTTRRTTRALAQDLINALSYITEPARMQPSTLLAMWRRPSTMFEVWKEPQYRRHREIFISELMKSLAKTKRGADILKELIKVYPPAN